MSWVLLFSGQGSQHPAMLPWLDPADPLLREAARRLGAADWRAVLADPARRHRNAEAQLLLNASALAAWHQLAPGLPPPRAVAGYSVGELAAASAAGAFDAATALDLAEARARAMDACAAREPGGLIALAGLAPDALLALAQTAGLHLAIDRLPALCIAGGPPAALDRAEQAAAQAGALATRLAVGLASHTPAMQAAATAFALHLAHTPVQAPRLPLLAADGAQPVRHAAEARARLAGQIARPLCWRGVVEQLADQAPKAVLEIGPGNALARDWASRFPHIPARSADEFRSAAAVQAWVRRQLEN